MLRSGPFSDEVVVGLLNARFIPLYFDLSKVSPARDEAARAFVVAARKELGGFSVPTPPVLFMTADGEVVGEVSNYATEAQMIDALRNVLTQHPDLAQPAAGEAEFPRLERARIAQWLGDDDAARAVLEGEHAPEESLFLAQLARRAGELDRVDKALAELDPDTHAADLTLERGLIAWSRGDYETMRDALASYPAEGPRSAEARYHLGLAQFHLGTAKVARATWKALVEVFGENRWSYRADWAYFQTTDEGMPKARSFFTISRAKSLLGRHGYMGRQNPDLTRR